jgi:hypothetical protein
MLLSGTAGGKGKKKGGKRPIVSDGGVDWYGEVSAEEFITGDALASVLGLAVGSPINQDSGWLNVGLDGIELYVAKKPFLHSVTWDQLANIGLINGDQTIVINNDTFKVRLLGGVAPGLRPTTQMGYDLPITHGSEWNRIIYRLVDRSLTQSGNTTASEEPHITFVPFTNVDLGMISNGGSSVDGGITWCRESDGGNAVNRGRQGYSHYRVYRKSDVNRLYGWRPVLEKVA